MYSSSLNFSPRSWSGESKNIVSPTEVMFSNISVKMVIESLGLLKKKNDSWVKLEHKLQALASYQGQKQRESKLIKGEPNKLFKTFYLFQKY